MERRTAVGYVFMKGLEYVAMDLASGGYPYITENPRRAKVWGAVADALNYHKSFRNDGWVLRKMFIETVPYEVTEEDLDD